MKALNEFVDKISSKFGYSEMLTKDLKRILPIMLQGKDDNKKEMLYNALENLKIFVLPNNATIEDFEKCKFEVFGGSNKGVTFIDADQGEYSKGELAEGSYISEPIFDDNMNIIGRNRMIYIKELNNWQNKIRELYDSNIDLSHLIHEIGHAWASEKDEYVQNSDGNFVQNVGTTTITHIVDKKSKTVKGNETKGLFLEESLNTIMEENVVLTLTGAKDIRELEEKYYYIRSSYQGLQTNIVKLIVEKFGLDSFEEYRFNKDRSEVSVIEAALAKTNAWTTLSKEQYAETKRNKVLQAVERLEIASDSKEKIKDFFKEYDDVYFSTAIGMTPMDKIDNVLTQVYNFGSVKYKFDIMGSEVNQEIFKTVIGAIKSEALTLNNEAVITKEVCDKDINQELLLKTNDDKQVNDYYKKELTNKEKSSVNREI